MNLRKCVLAAAMTIAPLLAAPTATAQTWDSGRRLVDALSCRTSQSMVLKNVEGRKVLTDRFQIVQNQNRNYATLYVTGKSLGLASYHRSKNGQLISATGWDVKLALTLVPQKNARQGYTGVIEGTDIRVRCAFERVTLD